MSWIARLVNVFRAEKVSEDIDRELAFHLAERTDALIADGASPEAARREARRRFGSYTVQRENTRDRDLLVWLESFGADVRYGLRGLVRSPIFAATCILTLAIGIGANTTVFTLLHGLMLRSLPVTAPPSWCASTSSSATVRIASAVCRTEWSASCLPRSGRSSTSRGG